MKAALWTVAALALAMATFPNWSVLLLAGRSPAVPALVGAIRKAGLAGGPATIPAGAETLTLKISGMDCAACTVSIRRSLERVPGVFSAGVDFDSAKATVVANAKVDAAAALAAVATAGYKAVVVDGGPDGKPKS